MSEKLHMDDEDIEEAWLVCFGDDEGWHPSCGAGLFFSYAEAEAFVKLEAEARKRDNELLNEWVILRCLPFKLTVVNDFGDPEHPLNRKQGAILGTKK